MTTLLQVEDLTKVYGKKSIGSKGGTLALEGFNLTVSATSPRITTIAGESGSGKTTLANAILGFLTPTAGRVLFEGKDIWNMSRREWFAYRRQVQAIFQDPYGVFNPFYPVDVVFNIVIKKFKLADNRDEAQQMIENSLEIVGLRPNDVLGKFPHQLSGGQRQRIMIARAFLLKPRLIVADEPVSMIDASLQGRILSILVRLRSEYGISFLYITHDLSTAYQINSSKEVLSAACSTNISRFLKTT